MEEGEARGTGVVCCSDRKFIYLRPDCKFSGYVVDPTLQGCIQLRAFTPKWAWYLQRPGRVRQSALQEAKCAPVTDPGGVLLRPVVLVRFLVVPVEVAFTGDASVSLETSVILSASAARSPNSVFVEDARILLTSWGS